MKARDWGAAEDALSEYCQARPRDHKGWFMRARAQSRLGNQTTALEFIQRSLAVKLAQFAEAVEVVARDCYPNLLCNYLFELAEAFMRFYESCPVLKADEPVRTSRLQFCRLTARTIQTGLGLLGIETVERM